MKWHGKNNFAEGSKTLVWSNKSENNFVGPQNNYESQAWWVMLQKVLTL